VVSSTCGSSCVNTDKTFNHSASTTYDCLKPGNLSVLDGSVKAHISEDEVRFGGFNATNQTFYLAAQTSNIQAFEFDGMIGLGPSGTVDILQNLVNESFITKKLFSLYLGNNTAEGVEPFSKETTKPNLVIGGYDLDKYSSSKPKQVSISAQDDLWVVDLPRISIGSSDWELDSNKAIVDPLSNWILVPSKAIQNLLDGFNQDSGSCKVENTYIQCNSNFSVPEFSFQLGSEVFDFSIKPLKDQNSLTLPFKNTTLDYWVLGNSFLKNYYSIFDYENKTLLLAETKTQGGSGSSDKDRGRIAAIIVSVIVGSSLLIVALILLGVKYLPRRNSPLEQAVLMAQENEPNS